MRTEFSLPLKGQDKKTKYNRLNQHFGELQPVASDYIATTSFANTKSRRAPALPRFSGSGPTRFSKSNSSSLGGENSHTTQIATGSSVVEETTTKRNSVLINKKLAKNSEAQSFAEQLSCRH